MNSPKLENLHQIEEILDLYNLPKLILNYQIKFIYLAIVCMLGQVGGGEPVSWSTSGSQ